MNGLAPKWITSPFRESSAKGRVRETTRSFLLSLVLSLSPTLSPTLPLKGEGVPSSAVVADLITQADQAWSARTPTAGADKALALYEQAFAGDKTSVVALWKAGRACHWLADHDTNKSSKLPMFEKGMKLEQQAIAIDPNSAEAHFWLAALYGSYGEVKGVLKSLALVKPIRKELEEVNRINDRYQGGAGYRVLGIVDYKVPGFAGGNKKRALEELNKAIAIDATNVFNHYYLAEYFATAAGDKKKALEILDTLQSLTVTNDVDAADLDKMKQKGQSLRRQIGT